MVKVIGGGDVDTPAVFSAAIRTDIVQFVHSNVAKNARQAYGVKVHNGPKGIVAGHQHSAHSWGTGRAVARIPRVSGSGTHRAGQAAFGNMCRGGRMFGPTKTWRKWQKKVNQKQRRYATASAIAASGILALVQARGHKVEALPSLPAVVAGLGDATKAADAVKKLNDIGLGAELARAAQKSMRPGKGKLRNRRFKKKRGPLIVYADGTDEEDSIKQNYRNIPGVDICAVSALNILQLAPGGHLGRLVVWTEAAFKELDNVYANKSGFTLSSSSVCTNADIAKIINSSTVQQALRAKQPNAYGIRKKKNGLKNIQERLRLDPAYKKASAKYGVPGPDAPPAKKARTGSFSYHA